MIVRHLTQFRRGRLSGRAVRLGAESVQFGIAADGALTRSADGPKLIADLLHGPAVSMKQRLRRRICCSNRAW